MIPRLRFKNGQLYCQGGGKILRGNTFDWAYRLWRFEMFGIAPGEE